MDFAVDQRVENGGVVLDVQGDIDVATASQLWREIEPQLDTTRHVVVDLSKVSFIDSTGIGTLVRAVNALRDRGQRLTVRGPSPMTRTVFETVGLTRLVDVEP
ncbi:MAG TPA: STAS domain-containing protein [Acidimicrobiales bacterium]|jgi:anti-sigma B factor antagonist|nr:STAS domain-containing protein [Acidimicrobiales bacterium]